MIVVLNTYKRIHLLKRQIKAVQAQGVFVEIFIWRNDSEPDYKFDGLNWCTAGGNKGVWKRFYYAHEQESEFYWILDDDTIPGKNYLRFCLDNWQDSFGVVSSSGFRFETKDLTLANWNKRTQLGWKSRNTSFVRCDWPGHSWIITRKVLDEFVNSRPLVSERFSGEDVHLAFSAQKLGFDSFVSPYPKDNSYWGSTEPDNGNDSAANWRVNGMREKMLSNICTYRDAGWRWVIDG